MAKKILLQDGAGGRHSRDLIRDLDQKLHRSSQWTQVLDDGAIYDLGDQKLVFTTDSYTVTPLFFPGGNIGKLSVCGTINDLAVMGADPIGLSLSFIIEEGFERDKLNQILESIQWVSQSLEIGVVTGDTKVMEKGKLDGLVINTAGVGLAETVLNEAVKEGDQIICSGSLGDHTTALLSKRFDYQVDLKSDCAPIWKEIKKVRHYIKRAKDPTRGGLASCLNELIEDLDLQIEIQEQMVPFEKPTLALCGLLGLDPYHLASEGRFIGVVDPKQAPYVLEVLKKMNSKAAIIGTVKQGRGVWVQTRVGKKPLEMPRGFMVPRIC